MKVSIIIPHYNSAVLLGKLISTIPLQQDIQVIVVDDNSTKETQVLDNLSKEYPEILFLKNEPGKNSAGRCRNLGLEKACGEWLLFADADDFFMEGLWDKITPYLNQKEYDIVYFKPTSVFLDSGEEAGRHVRTCQLLQNYLEEPGFYNECRLRYYFEAPWSKLIRRSVVSEHKVRFDETMVANDIMFSMKTAFYANHVAVSNETIYCITQSCGTLTTTPGKENFEGRFEVFLRKHQFLKKHLSKKAWRAVDILGEPYLKMARRNGMSEDEIRKVRSTLRKEGIRIRFSRKWTPVYVMKKIVRKMTKRGSCK